MFDTVASNRYNAPYAQGPFALQRRKAPQQTGHIVTKKEAGQHERDIMLDSPLRFLGYGDEGAAAACTANHPSFKAAMNATKAAWKEKGLFAALLAFQPKAWWLGMGISFTYVVADVILSARRASKASQVQPKEVRKVDTIAKATERGVFHALATFIAPIAVLEGIKRIADRPMFAPAAKRVEHLLEKYMPAALKRAGLLKTLTFPAIVALASIPFVSHPIDRTSEKILAHTYEPLSARRVEKLTAGKRIKPIMHDHTSASELMQRAFQPPVEKSHLFRSLFK